MQTTAPKQTLRDHAAAIEAKGVRCNCDLDNWEPTRSTGHSEVCRIHKTAVERFHFPPAPRMWRGDPS